MTGDHPECDLRARTVQGGSERVPARIEHRDQSRWRFGRSQLLHIGAVDPDVSGAQTVRGPARDDRVRSFQSRPLSRQGLRPGTFSDRRRPSRMLFLGPVFFGDGLLAFACGRLRDWRGRHQNERSLWPIFAQSRIETDGTTIEMEFGGLRERARLTKIAPY